MSTGHKTWPATVIPRPHINGCGLYLCVISICQPSNTWSCPQRLLSIFTNIWSQGLNSSQLSQHATNHIKQLFFNFIAPLCTCSLIWYKFYIPASSNCNPCLGTQIYKLVATTILDHPSWENKQPGSFRDSCTEDLGVKPHHSEVAWDTSGQPNEDPLTNPKAESELVSHSQPYTYHVSLLRKGRSTVIYGLISHVPIKLWYPHSTSKLLTIAL